MKTYNHTFCHPLEKEIEELGSIRQDQVIEKFKSIDWVKHLTDLEAGEAKGATIYFSPSIEFEQPEPLHGIVFSALGNSEELSFLIFYKRMVTEKKFFGGTEEKEKVSEIEVDDIDNALSVLELFVQEDFERLEEMFN